MIEAAGIFRSLSGTNRRFATFDLPSLQAFPRSPRNAVLNRYDAGMMCSTCPPCFGVREGDFGAEPDAVEISYVLERPGIMR